MFRPKAWLNGLMRFELIEDNRTPKPKERTYFAFIVPIYSRHDVPVRTYVSVNYAPVTGTNGGKIEQPRSTRFLWQNGPYTRRVYTRRHRPGIVRRKIITAGRSGWELIRARLFICAADLPFKRIKERKPTAVCIDKKRKALFRTRSLSLPTHLLAHEPAYRKGRSKFLAGRER